MRKNNPARTLWLRRSLATKLAISYAAVVVLMGALFIVASVVLISVELRRTSSNAALGAASAAALAINEAVEAYHDTVLMTLAVRARDEVAASDQIDLAAVSERLSFLAEGTTATIMVLDPQGSPVAGSEPAESSIATMLRDQADQLTPGQSGFHLVEPEDPETDEPLAVHTYSLIDDASGALIVAAQSEDGLLREMPREVLLRILDRSGSAQTLAAALILDSGEVIAGSTNWETWSEPAGGLPLGADPMAIRVEGRLGRNAKYLATARLPLFRATAAAIYDAGYLESFLGRFLGILAAAAVITLVAVVLVSRSTARMITAPVRRAARRLVHTAQESPHDTDFPDEMSGLVQRLLRASVKLEYEQRRRERAEDELAIASTVYHNTSEGIVVFEPDGMISRVNPSFEEITGKNIEELRAMAPWELVPEELQEQYGETVWAPLAETGEFAGEIALVGASGVPVPVLLSVRAERGSDGRPRRFIGVVRDISDIRSTQDRLEHLATHDQLTGLSNRTYLTESLNRVIQARNRRGGLAAVLFVDVDHFKDVNDAHGHHAGDELLRMMATRLKTTIRAQDLVSRFGGDEFVVVITEVADVPALDKIVRRMQMVIREPEHISGITVRPSVTVGIAVCPDSGTTPEDLLKNADAAMYEAKRIGRGGYRYHSPETNEAVRVRLAVRDKIRFSLRTGDLVLLWQPVMRLSDSRVIGAEGLVRLRSEDGSLLSPQAFLPQIEGSHVMLELARWVLDTATTTVAGLDSELPEEFRVAVNITAAEILQRDFVPAVLDTLEARSVPASRLAVEVTEGAAIKDVPTAQSVIRGLRRHGVKVYLDDFGVGYSSLQYLRELGVDTVKLDKSFLTDVPESDASCSLVRGVVDMAHGLGLTTTVEGVERREQYEFLGSIGCDNVQGYYIGRPMPVDRLVEMIMPGRNTEASS